MNMIFTYPIRCSYLPAVGCIMYDPCMFEYPQAMFSPYYFSRYWLLSSVSLRSLIRSVGIRILIAVTIARLFFIYTFCHLDSSQTDTQR